MWANSLIKNMVERSIIKKVYYLCAYKKYLFVVLYIYRNDKMKS